MVRLAELGTVRNGHADKGRAAATTATPAADVDGQAAEMAAPIAGKPTVAAIVPAAEALLWSITEAAGFLRVSEKTINRKVALGEMPAPLKLGRRRLFSRKSIEDWISRGCPAVRRK